MTEPFPDSATQGATESPREDECAVHTRETSAEITTVPAASAP